MAKKPRIIAIVGPTASGKTPLAISLARSFGGEIVSADSRQIYRDMDIGTAKPTPDERAAIPHHLIDIKSPDEEYTVADYKVDAIAAIDDVVSRSKVPFLVGGTGLYIKSVIENLDIPSVQADPVLRAKIEDDIKREGLPALFQRLLAIDPEAEGIVDPKNPRRVVRALEVATLTGEPFTAQRKKGEPLFDALVIGLDPGVEVLRERIERRVDAMMENGLIDEVAALIQKYGDAAAFNAIGYWEVIDHLRGGASLEKTVAAIKMDTWHYAKRQLTWFKKDTSIHWIQAPEEANDLVKNFLK